MRLDGRPSNGVLRLAIQRTQWLAVAAAAGPAAARFSLAAHEHPPTPNLSPIMRTFASQFSRLFSNALAVLALVAASPVWAQQIQINPANSVLLGDPLQIVLTGFPPGAELELKSQRVVPDFTGGRRMYAAQARFKAGAEGRVDLARAPTAAPTCAVCSGPWPLYPALQHRPRTSPAMSPAAGSRCKRFC